MDIHIYIYGYIYIYNYIYMGIKIHGYIYIYIICGLWIYSYGHMVRSLFGNVDINFYRVKIAIRTRKPLHLEPLHIMSIFHDIS